MDERAILKQSQNNKLRNKGTAEVGEAKHNGEVFEKLPTETLLHPGRHKKKKTAGRDYFHKMKLVQKKMKPPYGEAVGIGCCCVGRGLIWEVNGTQLLPVASSGHPSSLPNTLTSNPTQNLSHTSVLFVSFILH